MNADFQLRISGVVALDGRGTFLISPKGDPIVLLLTKALTDTPTGSVEVRVQHTGHYKYDGGEASVMLLVELLRPNGSVMAASSLTKTGLSFPPELP